jgi:hypothetical protein
VACSLADVDNVSIAGIWLKIFSQLPAAGLATCRLVCKLWARDIGDGVTHIKYHCTEEVPRPYLQQQDLVTLALAFRNVEELDVNYPYTEWLENLSREYHKVGVHADEADWLETPVLNFQTISLPRLRKLKLTCVPLVSPCQWLGSAPIDTSQLSRRAVPAPVAVVTIIRRPVAYLA